MLLNFNKQVVLAKIKLYQFGSLECISCYILQSELLQMLALSQVISDSIAFSLGLATTLAILGVAASFAGKAYGQVGQGLPIAASALAVIMGLNLLEVGVLPNCFYDLWTELNFFLICWNTL